MAISPTISEFVRERYGTDVRIDAAALRGGLEAEGISRVVVRRSDKSMASFVAKPFMGAGRRELYVYRLLAASEQRHFAPELLGWRYADRNRDSGYMFLEWVAAQRRWPWRDLSCSAAVIEQLATLHAVGRPKLPDGIANSWDYERELADSAISTVDLYRDAFLSGVRPFGRPMLPALERVVGRLPRLRRELMLFAGTTLLHGDAHPGNVMMRNGSAVLLDWGRARIGSPLEDVSSWVHTLSFWEPEARRRHDTLLDRYRTISGKHVTLSREYRDALAVAGASNALAGALRYHLAVAMDSSQSARQRTNSYCAAGDWLRIIRRADACSRC